MADSNDVRLKMLALGTLVGIATSIAYYKRYYDSDGNKKDHKATVYRASLQMSRGYRKTVRKPEARRQQPRSSPVAKQVSEFSNSHLKVDPRAGGERRILQNPMIGSPRAP